MGKFRRLVLAIFILFVCVNTMQFSNLSENQNPRILKDYVLDNAYLDTGAENSVTSIYLYYRYYDTLFEALMLLFSIIAVIYMSIHGGDKYDE